MAKEEVNEEKKEEEEEEEEVEEEGHIKFSALGPMHCAPCNCTVTAIASLQLYCTAHFGTSLYYFQLQFTL